MDWLTACALQKRLRATGTGKLRGHSAAQAATDTRGMWSGWAVRSKLSEPGPSRSLGELPVKLPDALPGCPGARLPASALMRRTGSLFDRGRETDKAGRPPGTGR
ncbi:unnamed protein product [Calypogeia fissa]